MFIIKKIILKDFDNNLVENALRKYSIRKGFMIEFASKSSYSKIENKFFFAKENDKCFEATRIKYPFENLLPRLIVKINKSNFSEINFRYSLLSFFYCAFLLLLAILSLINGEVETLFLFLFCLPIIQIVFTIIEYKLTLKTMLKTINSYKL